MSEITPTEFKDAFEQVTREQLPILLASWNSQPRFTSYVKTKLMPRIAELLECSTECEYNRIDIVFRKMLESTSPYSQDIAVAIEHENNFGGSTDEVRKLRMHNALLGVVITYVGNHLRQGLLDNYSEVLRANSDDNSTKRWGEILVIFGPYGMKPPRTLSWEYFIYNGQRFEPLIG